MISVLGGLWALRDVGRKNDVKNRSFGRENSADFRPEPELSFTLHFSVAAGRDVGRDVGSDVGLVVGLKMTQKLDFFGRK